jgi:catechol 2,3-dioxygenase-like lactoylglutathione lyase family enzyme
MQTETTILTDDLLDRLAKRCAGYDQDNRFFQEDFEDLRLTGYLTMAVPQELGGRGLDLLAVGRETRRLAYCGPATALGTNMHVYWTGVAADLWRAGDRSLEWLLKDAAAGEIFNAGHSEEMSHRGFSHIGLSTLDLDKTREFYEGVLGFRPVVADTIKIEEGGHLRHLFFDVGRDQLIAFLEPNGVADVPTEYDAGINRGLGVPAGFYHFAFEAGSPAALAEKRDALRARGVETTDIVDHGWAQSIYFKDPNGLSLEYCCMVRSLTADDARMQERFSVPRGALELDNRLSAKVPAAKSAGGTREA